MNASERDQLADRIFSAALDWPEPERRDYARQACGDDEQLLGDVLSLLESEEASRSMEEGAGQVASDALLALADLHEHPGQRVGPYIVGPAIGRGGMSSVYRAQREDDARPVALKVLRRGVDTADVLRRFAAEQRILASLDHPNIARLLDTGVTDDGRPFVAMELVEGETLTRHAEQHSLTVAQRLRLFLQVVHAVQHAHDRFVVHRDIKPANVLVDREGSVRLLDFGISRILDDSAEAEVRTRTGTFVLTPEYAAPEQLRGEAITAATDVYQLGVLLYEVLTGERPEPGPDDGAPVAPSAAVQRTGGSIELLRRLKGELDAILLTALAPDPEDRYPSPRAFGDDLERHLAGRPVHARRESRWMQAWKLAQRHRAVVATLIAGLVLLSGWIATALLQRSELRTERDRARIEAAKAGEVTRVLVELFEAPDPYGAGAGDVSAAELLSRGRETLDRELADQPSVRLSLLSTIARVLESSGRSDEAIELYESIIAERRKRGGVDPQLPVDMTELAQLLDRTDIERSDELFRDALVLSRKAHGTQDPRYANTLLLWGRARTFRSDADAEGRAMMEEAVTILERAGEEHREQLSTALLISSYRQPPEKALPRMQRALEIRREIFGPDHLSVAMALNDIALSSESLDPERSARLMKEALEIYERRAGAAHPLTLGMRHNLAGIYRDLGQWETAEPLYREALQGRRTHFPERRIDLAYTLYGLGITVLEQKRPAEAVPLFSEALEHMRASGLAADDPRIKATTSRLEAARASAPSSVANLSPSRSSG